MLLRAGRGPAHWRGFIIWLKHVKRIFDVEPHFIPADVIVAGVAGNAQHRIAESQFQIFRHAVLHLVLHLVEPFVFFTVAGLGGFNVIPANVGGGPAQARYAQSGKIQAIGGLPGTFILAVKI